MKDNFKLTVTYVGSRKLVMRYGRQNGVTCSIKRLRLQRQHYLGDIFKIDKVFPVAEVHGIKEFHPTYVPLFKHPHDAWLERHKLNKSYNGKVVAVGKDEFHLLVQIEQNVLVFVECGEGDFNKDQKTVSIVPYRYNRKTKKLYGYME